MDFMPQILLDSQLLKLYISCRVDRLNSIAHLVISQWSLSVSQHCYKFMSLKDTDTQCPIHQQSLNRLMKISKEMKEKKSTFQLFICLFAYLFLNFSATSLHLTNTVAALSLKNHNISSQSNSYLLTRHQFRKENHYLLLLT